MSNVHNYEKTIDELMDKHIADGTGAVDAGGLSKDLLTLLQKVEIEARTDTAILIDISNFFNEVADIHREMADKLAALRNQTGEK